MLKYQKKIGHSIINGAVCKAPCFWIPRKKAAVKLPQHKCYGFLSAMKDKRGGPISIVLLVIMTLMILISAIYIFAFKTTDTEEKLEVSGIDRVYAEGQVVNFYIDEIMDEVEKEYYIGINFWPLPYTIDPVEEFKKYLAVYNNKGTYVNPAFIQIDIQINNQLEQHVWFENRGDITYLIGKFNIIVSEVIYNDKDEKTYAVKHTYEYYTENKL